MARRKKQEVQTETIGHYETVVAFVNQCFKEGQVMCISPKFGETYRIKGREGVFTFTEEVLADMLETGKVTVTFRNEKEINLRGVAP